MLSHPDKVETYRLLTHRDDKPTSAGDGLPRLHGHPIIATGPVLGPEFGSQLAAVFFSPDAYDFDRAKGCLFDPGVAFRVHSGRRYVDLLLCFSCNEHRFYAVDEAGNVTRESGEDFDRARPKLVRLAKQAFPNDPTISALKEE